MAKEDGNNILISLGMFAFTSAASYLFMLPVETWVDAARTSIMHSTAAEGLVAASADGLAGDAMRGLSGFLTDNFVPAATQGAFLPDAGAVEALTQSNAFSATNVFGGISGP
jgi:hypothetical protein